LRVAAPAIVQYFDSSTNTVTAQIAVSELAKTPLGPMWMQIEPIQKVPVALPSCGGFSVTLPLQQGDEGLLVFCDSCIDLWWQDGGIQPPPTLQGQIATLPQPNFERRRHDLTDCVFVPGARSQPRKLSNYSSSSLQIRSDDGTVVVDVSESGVKITGPKVTLSVGSTGTVQISSLPTYANNAAALAAGLVTGDLYQTGGLIFSTVAVVS